jgi:hypothetical protein
MAAGSSLIPDSLSHQIDFTLPETLAVPLWRSLVGNIRDSMFPEKLPPLQLTSRPVDVGMLMGDFLALGWYRTIFTNLGNVIAPETLPPLELESRPLEVEELVSDRMSHMWWSSLLRNLADAVAPEKLPTLPLTAAPVNASLRSGSMQLMRWSSLASWPKVNRTISEPAAAARPTTPVAAPQMNFGAVLSTPAAKTSAPATHSHGHKLKNKLGRSRMREGIWISIATAEIVYLLITWIGPHWTAR